MPKPMSIADKIKSAQEQLEVICKGGNPDQLTNVESAIFDAVVDSKPGVDKGLDEQRKRPRKKYTEVNALDFLNLIKAQPLPQIEAPQTNNTPTVPTATNTDETHEPPATTDED